MGDKRLIITLQINGYALVQADALPSIDFLLTLITNHFKTLTSHCRDNNLLSSLKERLGLAIYELKNFFHL